MKENQNNLTTFQDLPPIRDQNRNKDLIDVYPNDNNERIGLEATDDIYNRFPDNHKTGNKKYGLSQVVPL